MLLPVAAELPLVLKLTVLLLTVLASATGGGGRVTLALSALAPLTLLLLLLALLIFIPAFSTSIEGVRVSLGATAELLLCTTPVCTGATVLFCETNDRI